MENGTEKPDQPPQQTTAELTALKKVAAKAITEHEELRKKYKALEVKFRNTETERNELNKLLRQTSQEFDNLKSVSEVACKDYTDLSIQLEMESQCRVTAESFASRMVKENRDIKRKSTAFLARSANPDFARQYQLALEEEEDELSSGGEGSADSQEISELRTQCDGE
ncbi:uncharacterized protein [Amphiura filiformis]|uniref:uncharacterized protein n=1 Tax=Amphiura filiformis TaxID=82378 RepID=UPI003B2131C1